MLNIPKENIKSFILIVLGLAILIIFSLIIDIKIIHKNVFDKPEEDMTQYTNVPESKFEDNKYEIVSEERRILYYADEVMDMINKKEFDKLYNILDNKYRSMYVKSWEELAESMSRFDGAEYSISYDGYYREGNMYLIDVKFNKTSLSREDIINSTSTPSDTWCIKESEKGKYTVAFKGFIDNRNIDKEKKNDLVKIKVSNVSVRANSTDVLISIENLTDQKIKLYDDRLDIYIVHNGSFKYIMPSTIESELDPKEVTIYKLNFGNTYSTFGKPRELVFNRITDSTGKIEKISIDL